MTTRRGVADPSGYYVGARDLDRSKAPDPLTMRAGKRAMVVTGQSANFVVRPVQPLSFDELEQIAATIRRPRAFKSAWLRHGLQEIAGTYLRQSKQAEPSRAEARFQLAMLSHLAWHLENSCNTSTAHHAELKRAVATLNGVAMSALWGGLERHPRYAGPDFYSFVSRAYPDWEIIGQAAATGNRLVHAGDYSNKAATIAVQDLIELYRGSSASAPTFSTKPIGSVTATGGQRTVGRSECFGFVRTFFAIVDQDLTAIWLTGKMQALLHPRSRRPTRVAGPIFPTSSA